MDFFVSQRGHTSAVNMRLLHRFSSDLRMVLRANRDHVSVADAGFAEPDPSSLREGSSLPTAPGCVLDSADSRISATCPRFSALHSSVGREPVGSDTESS